ncbi:extensin family protein [Yoonia sp. I 8.24]|uniref:extensin-like domain-containing protein n=1 Tax=Yoonia sp. I 8.24 TaxID=1537229 RepID=UPI001EDC953C|nr:extensin family protein [Yoonia sp. I 8.24]MCG3268509.1 extensin family protein [Yoonia sp. I 8.24]
MRHSIRQAKAQAAEKSKKRDHPILRGAVAFFFAITLIAGGYGMFVHPETPLPRAWNPMQPLRIDDQITPLTAWKLSRASDDPALCLAALDGYASFTPMNDMVISDQCHIQDRVTLSAVGQAKLDEVETRCAIALRLAMWEHHSLQPAAQQFLSATVQSITQIGSYNCRAIRTLEGTSTRMSTHATAEAIDISGFQFANGERISLLRDWDGNTPQAQFLRAARDGACSFFKLTLSPDYNALHADHFHLQSRGWGLCR